MTNSRRTDRPRLFRNTYWGEFESKDPDDYVIENRNKFAREYALIRKARRLPRCVLNLLYEAKTHFGKIDHVEVYENDWAYVVVFSNYVGSKANRDKVPEPWILYNRLYSSPDAETYLTRIPKR